MTNKFPLEIGTKAEIINKQSVRYGEVVLITGHSPYTDDSNDYYSVTHLKDGDNLSWPCDWLKAFEESAFETNPLLNWLEKK